jgi:hypothetical protein
MVKWTKKLFQYPNLIAFLVKRLKIIENVVEMGKFSHGVVYCRVKCPNVHYQDDIYCSSYN